MSDLEDYLYLPNIGFLWLQWETMKLNFTCRLQSPQDVSLSPNSLICTHACFLICKTGIITMHMMKRDHCPHDGLSPVQCLAHSEHSTYTG